MRWDGVQDLGLGLGLGLPIVCGVTPEYDVSREYALLETELNRMGLASLASS